MGLARPSVRRLCGGLGADELGPTMSEYLHDQIAVLRGERDQARADLKAYLADTAVTCAFCEARHDRPVTFEDIKAHIFECPKHPLTALRTAGDALAEALEELHPINNGAPDCKPCQSLAAWEATKGKR